MGRGAGELKLFAEIAAAATADLSTWKPRVAFTWNGFEKFIGCCCNTLLREKEVDHLLKGLRSCETSVCGN